MLENESSREGKFPGTKVPRNKSFTYRTFVPGNESFLGTKVSVTMSRA